MSSLGGHYKFCSEIFYIPLATCFSSMSWWVRRLVITSFMPFRRASICQIGLYVKHAVRITAWSFLYRASLNWDLIGQPMIVYTYLSFAENPLAHLRRKLCRVSMNSEKGVKILLKLALLIHLLSYSLLRYLCFFLLASIGIRMNGLLRIWTNVYLMSVVVR